MSGIHAAAAQVQRRAYQLADTEQVQAYAGSDNINYRVNCTDFMKMNLFELYTMYRCLCLT